MIKIMNDKLCISKIACNGTIFPLLTRATSTNLEIDLSNNCFMAAGMRIVNYNIVQQACAIQLTFPCGIIHHALHEFWPSSC